MFFYYLQAEAVQSMRELLPTAAALIALVAAVMSAVANYVTVKNNVSFLKEEFSKLEKRLDGIDAETKILPVLNERTQGMNERIKQIEAKR